MEPPDDRRTNGHVQSVERAISIMELLARTDWAGVTDIAGALRVHKSTASRLLSTLESRGLVEQQAQSGKYRLGFGLLHLAEGVVVGSDIRTQTRAACDWLAEQNEETVVLAVLESNEAVTVDQILSRSTVSTRSWLGRRTPLHSTSPGKVLLAHLEEEVREELIRGPHERHTAHTITDPQLLRAEIARVYADGYATTSEELEDGLSAAAAPVRALDGTITAAIGISGPSYRLSAEQLAATGRLVREAGEMASLS